MSKKKTDCSPEEWAIILEQSRESMRRSLAKPDVKERHRARQQARYQTKAEEIKTQKRERYKTDPTVKERARERQKERYNTDPLFKARVQASQKRIRSAPEYKATVRAKERAKSREKRTGASPEVVDALMVLQQGKCAVCGASFEKTPHVDHCHDTSTPRGLLCSYCNTAEGLIKKSGLSADEFGARLQRYLDNPPALVAQTAVELAG